MATAPTVDVATTTSEAGTPADFLFGVNDLNDGWVHILDVRGAAVEGGAVATVVPTDDGHIIIEQEVWWLNELERFPTRLAIGEESYFPHAALAFSSADAVPANAEAACTAPSSTPCAGPAATFASTVTLGVEPVVSDDGLRLTWEVPVDALAEAHPGGNDTLSFAVWSGVWYNTKQLGGNPDRADNPGANETLCDEGVDVWTNCPHSGGFFSDAKNEVFFAGFGDQDPYNVTGDEPTDGQPYGHNDAVIRTVDDAAGSNNTTHAVYTGLLGSGHTGRLAELGLKGHLDRMDWEFTTVDVAEAAEEESNALVKLINITSPAGGDVFGPGDATTVAWDAFTNDFTGLKALFRVDTIRVGEGLVNSTTEYTCTTVAPGEFECSADAVLPGLDGEYVFIVRAVADESARDATDAYCNNPTNGGANLCDSVGVVVDENPPSVEVCPLINGGCAAAGATLTTYLVEVQVTATDNGSGVQSVNVWAARDGAKTDSVGADANGDTVALDLRPLLDTPYHGTYTGDGITFHATAVDGLGNENSGDSAAYAVDTTGAPAIHLELVNDPETFVPNGAPVELTYRATWVGGPDAGQPADGETVVLEDAGDNGFDRAADTDLSGLVTFSLTGSDVARALTADVTGSTAEDVFTPDALHIVWTGISVSRASNLDAPRTNGWATVGEIYRAAYKVTFTHNGGAVEGARVTLTNGADFSGITGADGIVRIPVKKDVPSEATFTAEATYDPAGGPAQSADGDAVTLKWAKVVFSGLTPNATDWHDVGDTVTFGFDAELDYGAGVDVANGATVSLVLGDVTKTVALDEFGHGAVEVTFDEVTDLASPTLEPVAVPELSGSAPTDGIVYDAASYARQRWTEINLTVAADDDFVNTGDSVTLTLGALWAHDEDGNGALDDAVGAATVDVNDASGSLLNTCQVVAGASTCTVSKSDVYAQGLTLEVTSSDEGVTRQVGAVEASIDVVWTQIHIMGEKVDDDFVNVGDTVHFTGQAFWAHTLGAATVTAVPDATISLGDSAPTGCELGENNQIERGTLTVDVACSGVTDATIPLVVSSQESDDVTTLAAPLGFDAVWTELIVSYEVVDENGNPVVDGALFDHNAPVRFHGTVEFAHLNANPEGTPAPDGTFFAFFAEASDGEEFNCITEVASGACVTEVTKHEGQFTFDVRASSVSDQDGDGFVEQDITAMQDTPAPIGFRWTSIGFTDITCEGSRTGVAPCDTEWETNEIVTATVTAVAQDTTDESPREVLVNATITIAGQTYTTDENGEAKRRFLRFDPGSVTVWFRGDEATVDGQPVTWDTPQKVTLTWN